MRNRQELATRLEALNDAQLEQVSAYIDALLGSAAQGGSTWRFDFVEEFEQAKASSGRDPAGMEVKAAEATCDGVTKPAIWQHPPLTGAAILSYAVPIPPQLRSLKLVFFVGIRDGSQLPTDRYIAFRVVVNGWKLWSAVKNDRAWQEYTVVMPELAADVARIEFQTDGLGDHRWNWAVWGEPRLIAEE